MFVQSTAKNFVFASMSVRLRLLSLVRSLKILIHLRKSFQGTRIDYVKTCKYLGFHVVSDRHFKISIQEDIRGYFASANSILNSMVRPRENVLIRLLYTNCVPRLTYGAPIKDLNASERQQINVAINNGVRRIFGFRRWQSICQIRKFYNFKPVEVMFEQAKLRFFRQLTNHKNSVLRFLSNLEL